ncbi:MAG: glycosyltransferase family 2 protein [Candidatus Saccharibacteria bacterium]|nr:glycosyltransferase family 2 protein [Candidatus Saccharibacteria bacterium]
MKARTIVVIPAHNEAETIETVISDIKKEIKTADILVINDCSIDQTEAKIRCGGGCTYINNVHNMGYAMSVQTGIKYAKENNYDYVIQMDADGQHLASEAKKCLDAAIEKNADIVLGSRFKKNTGYKSPFFRRVGTSLFESLIRIFCHKTIKDPLTGLQVLNRRVIEYYSGSGAYPEYPDAGLIIEMLMKKYKIIEVPVKMKQRKSGTSMHDGLFSPVGYMIKQLYSCVIIFIKFVGRRYE